MNNLISVNLNDKNEPVVSIDTFEQLYVYVSKMKVKSDISGLKKTKRVCERILSF